MHRRAPTIQGRYFNRLSACVQFVVLLVTGGSVSFVSSTPSTALTSLCDGLAPYGDLQFRNDREVFAISLNHSVLDVSQGYISDVKYAVRLYSKGSEVSIRQFVITSLWVETNQFAGNFTPPLPSHVHEIEDCGESNVLSYAGGSGTDATTVHWSLGGEERGLGCVEFRAIIQGGDYTWYDVSALVCERPGNEIPGCMQFIDKTANGGVLASPNYPNLYPDDSDCLAFLHAEKSSRIFLQFLHFDIEYEQQCTYDFVNIYVDGVDMKRPRTICGQYDGSDLRQLWFQSIENSIVVRLSSDFKFGGQGYLAKFYSLDNYEGCNITFTNDSLTSGTIQSWNYPNSYFPNLMCNTLIKLDSGKRIRFRLDELELQGSTSQRERCDADYLRITGATPPGSSVTLCGSAEDYEANELVFDSVENELEVMFASDYLIEKAGFYGKFYALDSCENETVSGMNGRISSPNYPDNYPNSQDCYITITVPHDTVLLTFETFDLRSDAAGGDSCQDYVEIMTAEDEYKVCGNWQGKQNQLVYHSVSNVILVHFFADGQGTANGFQASYKAMGAEITDGVARPICPRGWIQFKENCYEIVHDEKTWSEAVEACELERTHLASIHTLQEQLFLNSQILSSAGHINGAYWIGGHDKLYEAEYMWQDRSIFNFTDWFPGWRSYDTFGKQPSDDGFSEEDCVELRQVFHYPSKGQGSADRLYWNDRHCQARNGYICKQLAFGAEVPTPPTTPDCDVYANATEGIITSLAYPQSYANSLDCTVTIEVPQGNRIFLEFTDFVIEDHRDCKYDFVKVFTPGREGTPATYCGDQSLNIKLLRQVTPGNVLVIRFHSDHSRTFKGFRANYWTESVPLYCDNINWIYNDGLCYLVNRGPDQRSSWTVAGAICQDHNATLAKITSAEQYYFVEESVRWNGHYSAGDVFWLGGSDIEADRQWVWQDGTPINETYTAWFGGWQDDRTAQQPSNVNNKDCLAMAQVFPTSDGATKLADKMYWMDELCNVKAYFICQKRSNSSPIQHQHIPLMLRSFSGNVSSPNFPNNYENNLDNVTVIEVPSGYRIKVEFLAFHLEYHKECLYDHLSLNDSIQYEVLCGNLSTQLEQLTFWSLTNQTTITFHSDHAITDVGYLASYEAVNIQSCANDVVGGKAGLITSFNFPEHYLNSLSCRTTIRVVPGYRVFLEFETFQLQYSSDCEEDYTQLILDSSEEKRTTRYCGDRTAQISTMKFVSYESVLIIEFHSNEKNVSKGFSASFTAVKEVTTIITLESKFSTNSVSSLNYPLPYPDNTNLTLLIRAPPNGHVVITFSGCLSRRPYNCTSSELKTYNYLLYGEKEEVKTPICGDTCNNTKNLVFRSTLNTLEIQFLSQTNLAQIQGFNATYYSINGNNTCGTVYCSDHGNCRYKENQYYCSCDAGYRGPFCTLKQGETEKTLLQRLMDDPFWIGIIAIIVFLLLGLFIVFLRKKINKYLQVRREESLRKSLGKHVRYNAGSTQSFVDSSSPSPHLNGDSHQLHNGNSLNYDPSRVNEIALHEIEIQENGHAVGVARDGEYYDDEWDEEMDGENNDGKRESGPRYLERHATLATALGRVVPAVALSSVKAKRYHKRSSARPVMEISFLRGPRRLIPNIWKQRGNDRQDGSKRETYLRTRKQVTTSPRKMVVIQNEPIKASAADDSFLIHEGHHQAKHSNVTDGDYLNEVFVTVRDEKGRRKRSLVTQDFDTSDHDAIEDAEGRQEEGMQGMVHEYAVAELYEENNWQGQVEAEYDIDSEASGVSEYEEHAIVQQGDGQGWRDHVEVQVDYNNIDSAALHDLHEEFLEEQEEMGGWEEPELADEEYGQESDIEDLATDGNVYDYEYDNPMMPDGLQDEIQDTRDSNVYTQYSFSSQGSSVDLSDIQPKRGRSRPPSLRSLHRQPVIFESVCEDDPPILNYSYTNGTGENSPEEMELTGLQLASQNQTNDNDISQYQNAMEMRSMSHDSGEGRFSDSDRETVILNRTLSQNSGDNEFEQNNNRVANSSFERNPSSESDVSNPLEDGDSQCDADSGVDQTRLRRRRLVNQKTSSNFSDLEPIEEDSILRTEDLWENQRLSIDNCTENSEEIV
ncbi:cubilin-like [Ptychodera flava]|uniref:cubilin-like n=1 Tax=Ptychodera flava TaxID=63121 RepID=UPI00396A9F43